MSHARVGLVAAAVAALIVAKTVSTVAFTGGVSGYYDEMKARLGQ